MIYAIICEDIENSLPKRLEKRPEHRARLDALQAQGKLIMAGPFPAVDSNEPGEAGFSGSLIVAEFESLEAAEKWAAEDPFSLNGTYASVTVKPFKKIFS